MFDDFQVEAAELLLASFISYMRGHASCVSWDLVRVVEEEALPRPNPPP